jgi:site-specific DNA recombinase
MTTNKKQGSIYGRKSRENEATLESQINACIDWCEKNDVEYELFVEEGTQSSENWDRPELQKMLRKIENLEYNFVIVSESSRISRTEDFSIFAKLMKETGTILVQADTGETTNFLNRNDKLKSGVQQVFNEYELDVAKTRLKRGTVQSAKKGNWVAKKAPVGYEYDRETKRLKLTKDAEVIKLMFDLYASGLSTVEITHKFNVENVLAYHKVKGEMVPVNWSKSTVSRMMHNIAYLGHTLYGKTKLQKIKGVRHQIEVEEDQQILVRDTHQPIVSKELWDKVHAIMKKKTTLPPAIKHAKHTFSGLIRCAKCNTVHTFEMGSNGKKRISSCKYRNYDQDFVEYTMCGNSGGILEPIEKLFYDYLEQTEKQIEKYIDLIKEIQLSGGKMGISKESQINSKVLQVQQMKKKRKKIGELIEDGFYDDVDEEIEKVRERKQLLNRINELEAEIQELREKEGDSEIQHIERVLDNIKKVFQGRNNPNITEKEMNDVLSDFIEKITYEKQGRFAKEIKIKVFLKDDISEIFVEGGDLHHIA